MNKSLSKVFLLSLAVMLVLTGCAAKEEVANDVPHYPRMPDAYRKNDYYQKTNQSSPNLNPAGYAIYDHAETEAEENYFGVEVVPLEESQKILQERRAKETQTMNKD